VIFCLSSAALLPLVRSSAPSLAGLARSRSLSASTGMALSMVVSEVSGTLASLTTHAAQRVSTASLGLASELSHDALTVANHLRLGLQASLDVRTCKKKMQEHPEIVGFIKELLFINGCFQIGIPILFLFVLQPLLQSLFPDGVRRRTEAGAAALQTIRLSTAPLVEMRDYH